MTLAEAEGWDFETTWAPASAGFYPELYAVNPVVWVDPERRTPVRPRQSDLHSSDVRRSEFVRVRPDR